MDQDVSRDWTLEDHLLHGRSAISVIASTPATSISKPNVCFHLNPLSQVDYDKWGMEADYCQRAKHEFDRCAQSFDVDYVGGHCGIEAWQEIVPDEDWLTKTVPLVWEIARKAKMSFEGWSFEPRSGPCITVSPTVSVYNGNNLSELPPSAVAESFGQLRNWFKSKLG